MARKKSKINIKESKKGTFTKAARKRGMSVQAFARLVLANKDKYSSVMVKKANFARNAKKFKHQSGGVLFPNATTYSELGSIPNNQINYTPSTVTSNIGRPKESYINPNQSLFQSGGSINIDLIDENDILHPSDSNNLSYRNDPIGMSIVKQEIQQSPVLHLPNVKSKNKNRFNVDINPKGFKAKGQYQINPNLAVTGQLKYKTRKPITGQIGVKYIPSSYQSGGVTASTPEEFKNGLNDGVNIFEFGTKGLKKMTMTPESGDIEYPVEYKGYTDGEQTDQGVALPGEDFNVNGDTVVETPDLTELTFPKAIDYANKNNLPIFKWKGKDYPMRRNMKYQQGGIFSSKVTNKTKLDPGFSPDIN